MLKQSILQKLQQKLSPQQIQVIKLLELTSLQLEERIKDELEENPILDVNDNKEIDEKNPENEDDIKKEENEFTFEDYIKDEDIPAYKLQTNNYSKDDKIDVVPFAVKKTFHELLHEQLELRNTNEKEFKLAEYLIGNIDNDGYIRRELKAIANDLAFNLNIDTTENELDKVLKIVQDFEPTGVGARNLQECLLLQIKKMNLKDPDIALAYKILEKYFELFTKKHYDKIIKKCKITKDKLKRAVDKIVKLNPKPGNAQFSSSDKVTQAHIIPDFVLQYIDGELILSLNKKHTPRLKINHSYIDIIQDLSTPKEVNRKPQKTALTFIKHKLNSAKWFIDAIKQRQEMLLATMETIIKYQKDFFTNGDVKLLKPMILKDIADVVDLDISTISRITNSKYIQTPFGIYSLKFFFSESTIKKTGEEVSTHEVKKILKECVDKEDKLFPLTDEKLVNILQKKSYKIARRTVAKYREQLGIPVARLRKKL